MTTSGKVTENRVRRMADRQGLRLVKSRRRDPRARDYGDVMLVDVDTNTIVAGEVGRVRFTIADAERWLSEDH